MGQTDPYFQDEEDPEAIQRRQQEQQLMAAQAVLGDVAPVSSMGDYAVAPSPVAAGAIASAPPRPPSQYQQLNQQLQDRLAKKPGALRTIGGIAAGIGANMLLRRIAPEAGSQITEQIMHPGVSQLAQRVQLAKQAQDESMNQQRLDALMTNRAAVQQGLAQNRQVQQSLAQHRAGARPIASAPTPLPPIPSGDQEPQVIPPPLGSIPTPPQVVGGAQPIPQPIQAAGQIPAPSTALASAAQVRDPLTGQRGQIPTPEDQKFMAKQAEAESARAAYEEQLRQRGIPTPEAIRKIVPGVKPTLLPEELAKYAPLVKTEQSETEKKLGDRVPQFNKVLEQRYQVLHPGRPLPPEYTLPPTATQKDYDEIQKALSGTEAAEGVKTGREQARATAEGNRKTKQDTSLRQSVYKTYTPAMDSAERFNVMAKNYENAIKNHDQQAMLSLLANHLGMTMGLQKGSRLTKDIINEAKQSVPLLQGLAAKFDSRGYLSGVTLTPEQMRQMVDLGRERFTEDMTKARNEAGYLGAEDDGPKRTPNNAVINHYTALANGDPQKAKQLAAKDGWTVQ